MGLDGIVKPAIGFTVFLMLFTGMIWGSYQQAQGTYAYEQVTSTSAWESAINAGASSNYTISNDTLTLDADGDVTTNSVSTDEHDSFTVNSEHLSGDLTVELYDQNDTLLDSQTTSGDTSVELSVENYTADSYYLTWSNSGTGDAEVSEYSTEGLTDRGTEVSSFLLIAMLLLVIGIAMGFKP